LTPARAVMYVPQTHSGQVVANCHNLRVVDAADGKTYQKTLEEHDPRGVFVDEVFYPTHAVPHSKQIRPSFVPRLLEPLK